MVSSKLGLTILNVALSLGTSLSLGISANAAELKKATGSCEEPANQYDISDWRQFNLKTSVAGEFLMVELSNDSGTFRAQYKITNTSTESPRPGIETIDAEFSSGTSPVGFDGLYVTMSAPYAVEMKHDGNFHFKSSQYGDFQSGAVFLTCETKDFYLGLYGGRE